MAFHARPRSRTNVLFKLNQSPPPAPRGIPEGVNFDLGPRWTDWTCARDSRVGSNAFRSEMEFFLGIINGAWCTEAGVGWGLQIRYFPPVSVYLLMRERKTDLNPKSHPFLHTLSLSFSPLHFSLLHPQKVVPHSNHFPFPPFPTSGITYISNSPSSSPSSLSYTKYPVRELISVLSIKPFFL